MSASPEALRAAYLDRARALHPDRPDGAGVEDGALRHRRMQEANEAWRVLGHPGRRQRYDAGLTGRRPAGDGFRSGWSTPFEGDDEDGGGALGGDGPVRVLRGLPWMLLLAVLGAIFVFTAYASGGRDATGTVQEAGSCVVVLSGPVAWEQPCGEPGSRVVVAAVAGSQPCPDRTERLQAIDRTGALCLEVAPTP